MNPPLQESTPHQLRAEAETQLTTARDELAKWRDCAEKLAEALKSLPPIRADTDSPLSAAYFNINAALAAYRALAAGQGEGAGT